MYSPLILSKTPLKKTIKEFPLRYRFIITRKIGEERRPTKFLKWKTYRQIGTDLADPGKLNTKPSVGKAEKESSFTRMPQSLKK